MNDGQVRRALRALENAAQTLHDNQLYLLAEKIEEVVEELGMEIMDERRPNHRR